jgi:hypothetical protein
MSLKAVAVVLTLSAISLAASAATEQGTQNNASTEKKRQILITANILSAEPNSPSATTFLKDKLKVSPIAPEIDPNNQEMQPYEMTDSQAIALINWLVLTAKAKFIASPKIFAVDGEHNVMTLSNDKTYIKEYKEPNDSTGKREPVYEKIGNEVVFYVTATLLPPKPPKQFQLAQNPERISLQIKLHTIELPRVEKKHISTAAKLRPPYLEKM